MEQWNSDSRGWWNGRTVIVKGGGSVAQCHNDSKGGDKETSVMFILDFRIPHEGKKSNRRIACDRCTTLSGYQGKQTVE